jgi:hypothetical protein
MGTSPIALFVLGATAEVRKMKLTLSEEQIRATVVALGVRSRRATSPREAALCRDTARYLLGLLALLQTA